ncbi:MAG: hypothetical protein ACJ72F_04800, partial [Nitrososphaeraceae archaeon]
MSVSFISKDFKEACNSKNQEKMTQETRAVVNKYNDPTLPGYNPGRASYEAATNKENTENTENKENKEIVNKYNDPTLPGYNPGRASYEA